MKASRAARVRAGGKKKKRNPEGDDVRRRDRTGNDVVVVCKHQVVGIAISRRRCFDEAV